MYWNNWLPSCTSDSSVLLQSIVKEVQYRKIQQSNYESSKHLLINWNGKNYHITISIPASHHIKLQKINAEPKEITRKNWTLAIALLFIYEKVGFQCFCMWTNEHKGFFSKVSIDSRYFIHDQKDPEKNEKKRSEKDSNIKSKNEQKRDDSFRWFNTNGLTIDMVSQLLLLSARVDAHNPKVIEI